jgi:hypothetical protein
MSAAIEKMASMHAAKERVLQTYMGGRALRVRPEIYGNVLKKK